MPLRPISVFISSTCYELADLRFELGEALRRDGFVVKMSDDPNSAFYVDPLDDSIGSCLSNAEASDVVVCIIDRRYGGVLKDGPRAGRSATELEVCHAREHGKPIFFFIREPAIRDYYALRGNPAYQTKWVEPAREEARSKWLEFVKWASELPKHENWSNWYDQFKTVLDLKPLVRKRLTDHFPKQLGALALDPERVLRLAFIRGATGAGNVRGHFRNIGPGPAYNVRHGSRVGAAEVGPAYQGGLAEGDDMLDNLQEPLYVTSAPGAAARDARIVFCEYENRFGDGYRVEIPLAMPVANRAWQFGADRFFVRVGLGEWMKISDGNER